MTGKRSKRDGLAIALGPEFMEMVNEISILEGVPLADIVEKIDRMRGKASRASAIRVFVLKYFESQAAEESGQWISA